MLAHQMVPVKKPHTNVTYTGPPGVDDLPTTIDESGIVSSVWTCKSLWERFKFFFHGEVTLRIYSKSIPPVSVLIGDINHFQEA